MNFRFNRLARRELDEAVDYHEAQRPGLGGDFAEEIYAAIARIRENPIRYPILIREFRRCHARRFRYSVIYRIRANEIEILAVMHQSRRPGYWRARADA